MKGRHLIEPGNFTIDELDKLFSLAETIMKNPDSYSEVCRGKVLATLFFEPSTRTRLSFEAAMLRLGGSTLGLPNRASSTSKEKSLADTIRTVASYVDIIAMRNQEGAALLASQYSDVPVINAGDGGHHHPTRTLTDLLTIRTIKRMGRTDHRTLQSDLKVRRTVHNLAKQCRATRATASPSSARPNSKSPTYIISRYSSPQESPSRKCFAWKT